MTTIQLIIREYKTERIPTNLIANLSLVAYIILIICISLSVFKTVDNILLRILATILVPVVGIIIIKVSLNYLSFFIGMPFLLISLATSVDIQGERFKDFAKYKIADMYASDEVDTITYVNFCREYELE